MTFTTTEPPLRLRRGTRPLLISMPHVGTHVPPQLAARLTDEYMFKVVKEGGAAVGKSPLMVAWAGALKDDEIRNVVAYVQKLKAKK